MIPPEEFNDIADLPDDLAFLKLEEKFRKALHQRHRRAEGSEDFEAIQDYVNHTCEAAVELGIEGAESWLYELHFESSQQEFYKHLSDLTQMVDRFRVRTQIAYVRKARLAEKSPTNPVTIDDENAFSASTSRLVATGGSFLATENGEILTTEAGKRLLVENASFSNEAFASNAFATDAVPHDDGGTPTVEKAYREMLHQAHVVESTLELRPNTPGIGHNGSPERIDGLHNLSDEDLSEINHFVAVLKSQPEKPEALPQTLVADVKSAGKLVTKLKSLGDSFITKFAESAGTEAGKIISAQGAFFISLALNLNGLIDAALSWIKLIGH